MLAQSQDQSLNALTSALQVVRSNLQSALFQSAAICAEVCEPYSHVESPVRARAGRAGRSGRIDFGRLLTIHHAALGVAAAAQWFGVLARPIERRQTPR